MRPFGSGNDAMRDWLTQLPAAEFAIVAIAFIEGSILGSFANVVIHRLPRGESVSRERSRCPACGAAIRPRDNVPILGWLLLGGRCRDCSSPIAVRYPLVEAACGTIAAAVAIADLAGTAPLPMLEAGRTGIDRLLMAGDWRLVVGWLLHAGALIVLVVWGLLERDAPTDAEGIATQQSAGKATCVGSAGLVLTALVVVTVVDGVGPAPLPLVAVPTATLPTGRLLASVIGLLVGRLLGALSGSPAARCGLTLLGAIVGWQPVTVVAIVTVVARRLAGRTKVSRPWRPLALVAAGTMVVVCWRPIQALLGAVWPMDAPG